MYGIDGGAELLEETLDHLSGYDNARPVRIGNGAYNQRQHDVWGTMLDSIFLHAKSRDHLPERRWPLIERLVEAAIENWQRPTAASGRCAASPSTSPPRRSCAGSRATAAPASPSCARHGTSPMRWRAMADEIHADIIEHGCDERASSPSTTTPTALDASRLLIPLVRFLPADDERIRARPCSRSPTS